MKNFAGDTYITHVYQKSQYMMHGSWDTKWDKQNFLSFWAIFCSFTNPPKWSRKSKFWKKKMKKMPGDIILLYILVYHRWRSFDIWFLKCKVWQTEIFVILGHFLLFQPLESLENQNFSIEKNTWRYYHFTHLHHKWQSYDVMVPEIWSVTDLIFCHFGPFFALLPHLTTQKIKIMKKWKKHLEIL